MPINNKVKKRNVLKTAVVLFLFIVELIIFSKLDMPTEIYAGCDCRLNSNGVIVCAGCGIGHARCLKDQGSCKICVAGGDCSTIPNCGYGCYFDEAGGGDPCASFNSNVGNTKVLTFGGYPQIASFSWEISHPGDTDDVWLVVSHDNAAMNNECGIDVFKRRIRSGCWHWNCV